MRDSSWYIPDEAEVVANRYWAYNPLIHGRFDLYVWESGHVRSPASCLTSDDLLHRVCQWLWAVEMDRFEPRFREHDFWWYDEIDQPEFCFELDCMMLGNLVENFVFTWSRCPCSVCQTNLRALWYGWPAPPQPAPLLAGVGRPTRRRN